MITKLKKLTSLHFDSIPDDDAWCHLSSVVMLSSLVHLKSLVCTLVDGTARYEDCTVESPADIDAEEASLVV